MGFIIQQTLVNLINQSNIKNKEIFLRQRNYGLPKNIIDARRFMFDWCGFEKIIVMEDDLIVTPQFIKLSLSLHDWAIKNVDHVGTTQMFTNCLLSQDEKAGKRACVREAASEWCIFVCYCMHKNCWETIRNTMYEFEKFIDMIPWSEEFDKQRSNPTFFKDVRLIQEWLKEKLKQRKQLALNSNKDTFESDNIDYESMIVHNFPCLNQDRIMGIALWLHGLCKIETVVNRAQHIGKQGVTINQNSDWTTGIHLDIFKEDATLTEFQLVAPNLEFALCGL